MDLYFQEEKYIALIFEKELTFPEQLILEEIFKEIGRSNNICNFPVKLSYEEAYSRLKTHKRAPKQQVGHKNIENCQLPWHSHLVLYCVTLICFFRVQITALEPEEDELPVVSQVSFFLLHFNSKHGVNVVVSSC